MDNQATQYFVKLHIIAGQMNTEHMNNTDTFYTLTGRSGEIFNGNKVRVSLMFTLRTKLLLVSGYTWLSLCIGGCERLQRVSFLIPCLSKYLHIHRKKWSTTPERVRQEGVHCYRKGVLSSVWFCSSLNSFLRQPSFNCQQQGEILPAACFLEVSAQSHICLPLTTGNGCCLF